jgi:hypothetical protein
VAAVYLIGRMRDVTTMVGVLVPTSGWPDLWRWQPPMMKMALTIVALIASAGAIVLRFGCMRGWFG